MRPEPSLRTPPTSSRGRSSSDSISDRCAEAGPVAATVARQLATRRDVLPAAWCEQLAAVPAVHSGAADADILHALFDGLPSGWFIDPEPESVRIATQVHRGQTLDGRRLRVEWPRPSELDDRRGVDACLGTLAAILGDADIGLASSSARALVLDAHRDLLAASTPSHRAGALRAMANVPTTVPAFEADLPRGVLAWIGDGTDLDHWWEAGPSASAARSVGEQLAAIWLAQALTGPALPTGAAWEHVVVTADGTPLWIGGALGEAEPACQQALESTLVALRDERPEASVAAFLDLFEPHPATDTLRRRLPMASPSDGAADPLGHGRLVEPLMLHWRLAIDEGLSPRPTTIGLLGGLASLDRLVREIAPEHDTVAIAVDRLMLDAERSPWGTAFDLGSWRRELEPIGESLARLPAQLDHALTRLADGDWTIRVEAPPAQRPTSRSTRWPALVGGLVLALCGFELSNPWLTPAAWLAAGLLIGQASRVVDAP